MSLSQDPVRSSREIDFVWNSQPDMRGGLSRLTEIFMDFVQTNLLCVQH